MGIVFGLAVGGAILINESVKSLRVILPDVSEKELHSIVSGWYSHNTKICITLLIKY